MYSVIEHPAKSGLYRMASVFKSDVNNLWVCTVNNDQFYTCVNDPRLSGSFYTSKGALVTDYDALLLGQTLYKTKPTSYTCMYCGQNYVAEDGCRKRICEACEKTRTVIMSDNTIHGHDFKPRALFSDAANRKKQLHMGFELEFDQRWSNNQGFDLDPADGAALCCELNRDKPIVYCKSDGSLDRGVEMVSMPMTYRDLVANKGAFSALFDNLKQEGWRSEAGGNCGFHIHCDKAFLGDDPNYTVAKLALLFGRWDAELTSISRRQNFEYCNKNVQAGEAFSSVIMKVVECDDRYVAVNNQNATTVEIRLWRGTLNIDTFYATLDLTRALVLIAKKYSVNTIQKLGFETVYKYMTEDCNIAKIKQLLTRKEKIKDDEEEE